MVRSIKTLADVEAALRDLDNQLNVLKHAAPAEGTTVVSTPTIILPNALVQLGKVITQNPAKAQIGGVGDSGKNYPLLFGNLANTIFVSASGNTTLITPSAGYYVTSITISVDPTSAKAVAGPILALITDSSSGNVWGVVFYVPNAVSSPASPSQVTMTTPAGFFWNNKVSGSTLRVNLSAAFTAGGIYVSWNYGLTTIVN